MTQDFRSTGFLSLYEAIFLLLKNLVYDLSSVSMSFCMLGDSLSMLLSLLCGHFSLYENMKKYLCQRGNISRYAVIFLSIRISLSP